MKITDEQIIDGLKEGKAIKQLCDIYSVSKRAIVYRLERLREKHDCASTYQLLSKLSKLEYAGTQLQTDRKADS